MSFAYFRFVSFLSPIDIPPIVVLQSSYYYKLTAGVEESWIEYTALPDASLYVKEFEVLFFNQTFPMCASYSLCIKFVRCFETLFHLVLSKDHSIVHSQILKDRMHFTRVVKKILFILQHLITVWLCNGAPYNLRHSLYVWLFAKAQNISLSARQLW